MADKKTTKKTVTNSVKDLRALSVDELQKQLLTARADLLTAQKSLRANELANPHAVTKLRREVARILTIIKEKDAVIASEAKQSSDKEAK
jgi:ribosomal protein L29